MQQIILYSGDQASRRNWITSNYPTSTYLHLHLPPDSLKIKNIREITSNISLTSSQPRLVWLEEAHHLTLPAQNALLKTLEEPPQDTTIILSTNSHDSLLATITSRCQLLRLKNKSEKSNLNKETLALIKQALKAKMGERLSLTKDLVKDREQALKFCDQTISSLYQVMQANSSRDSLKLLSTLASLTLTCRTQLLKNVNTKLAVENLFLSLPRST